MNTLEGIAQRRPFHRVVIFLRDASGTYLHFSFSILNGDEAKPRTSSFSECCIRQTCTSRRHSSSLRLPAFRFGAHFLRLKTPRIRWGSLPCTLRNWNPRPACGTAVKSVRISMSVCSEMACVCVCVWVRLWILPILPSDPHATCKRNTLETTIKAIKWSHPDHGGQC